jgi:hypothetical protein
MKEIAFYHTGPQTELNLISFFSTLVAGGRARRFEIGARLSFEVLLCWSLAARRV